jgi:hypothetical protein
MQPHRYFSPKGNPIKLISQSEWSSDDAGLYEFQHHVGRSKEGFHGGLLVSCQGGDGVFHWTNARSSESAALKASYGIRDARERGFDAKSFAKEHGHKNIKGLFAEIRHDEALAKIRDATGREPEITKLPATSAESDRRPQSKSRTLPRTRASWER